jgi:hypothetical protein
MVKDTKFTSKPAASKASESLQENSTDKAKTVTGNTQSQTNPGKKK